MSLTREEAWEAFRVAFPKIMAHLRSGSYFDTYVRAGFLRDASGKTIEGGEVHEFFTRFKALIPEGWQLAGETGTVGDRQDKYQPGWLESEGPGWRWSHAVDLLEEKIGHRDYPIQSWTKLENYVAQGGTEAVKWIKLPDYKSPRKPDTEAIALRLLMQGEWLSCTGCAARLAWVRKFHTPKPRVRLNVAFKGTTAAKTTPHFYCPHPSHGRPVYREVGEANSSLLHVPRRDLDHNVRGTYPVCKPALEIQMPGGLVCRWEGRWHSGRVLENPRFEPPAIDALTGFARVAEERRETFPETVAAIPETFKKGKSGEKGLDIVQLVKTCIRQNPEEMVLTGCPAPFEIECP